MRIAVSERQSGQLLVGMGKRYGEALTTPRRDVSGEFYVFRGRSMEPVGVGLWILRWSGYFG